MAQMKDGTITVAEAYERYPDEWVLMEITQPHKDYRRERGRVLAHSTNRGDLLEPHQRFRAEHPKTLMGEFYAGDLIPRDVVVVL
jgi:hypothetical protein